MKNFLQHIRVYIFRGLFAVIPILLCVFAVRLLYGLIDQRVLEFLNNFFEVRKIPGMGILLVLASLYLIGVIVSNIIGRQLLKFIENISQHIPFIKSIYGVGKQLSQTFFGTDEAKQAFKKVVLVKFDQHEFLTPAFVMSSVLNHKTGEELLFVFVPTVPTPAGGFVFLIKASQTSDPGWSVDEYLKIILSMGIIAPKSIKK